MLFWCPCPSHELTIAMRMLATQRIFRHLEIGACFIKACGIFWQLHANVGGPTKYWSQAGPPLTSKKANKGHDISRLVVTTTQQDSSTCRVDRSFRIKSYASAREEEIEQATCRQCHVQRTFESHACVGLQTTWKGLNPRFQCDVATQGLTPTKSGCSGTVIQRLRLDAKRLKTTDYGRETSWRHHVDRLSSAKQNFPSDGRYALKRNMNAPAHACLNSHSVARHYHFRSHRWPHRLCRFAKWLLPGTQSVDKRFMWKTSYKGEVAIL